MNRTQGGAVNKLIALCALAGALLVASQANARGPVGTLCVGHAPGCYPTIQAAVDAAQDGDTIRIERGTFAGGITIDKSISLVGAGRRATTISGGGPVVTIGEFLGAAEPTMTISGVTITGGVSTSSPLSTEWVGEENVIALGGGVEILPAEDYTTGATVTITNSIITGNRAAPTTTLPFGPPCPDGPCPFAWAKGGGIDNWGRLSLRNTSVSDNTAAGVASDADGGGINDWWPGTLRLANSTVTGNRAIASIPNGRFAEGGGIFTDPGVELTLAGSVVSGNTASLTSTLPYFVPGADALDMNANGGGIHVGDDSAVTIENTTFDGNVVSVNDPNGEPVAFDSAVHPGSGPLVLRDSRITSNRLFATVASSEDVGPSGSALDVNGPGTVSNVRITGNTTVVTSEAGVAEASGAVYTGDTASDDLLFADSVISGNSVTASSAGGSASIQGAGLLNEGRLTLRNDLIADNTGTATAPAGFAQGGGIWNGSLFNPPPIELTLENTNVIHNRLSASAGLAVQGGGLFTAFPVTLRRSRIAGNSPDDCYGC
jgi:hypothetical protein